MLILGNFIDSTLDKPVIVTVPTYEELCLETPDKHEDDGAYYIDIRLFRKEILNADSIYYKALNGFDYEINPIYKSAFEKYFLAQKIEVGIARKYSELEKTVNQQLDEGLLAILSINPKPSPPEKPTKLRLSKAEEKALSALLKHWNGGNVIEISITDMINEYHISRPVFNNLLTKLENAGLVRVTRKGTKGTEISVLDGGNGYLKRQNPVQ